LTFALRVPGLLGSARQIRSTSVFWLGLGGALPRAYMNGVVICMEVA